MVQNVIRLLQFILTAYLSVAVSASHSRSRVVHNSLANRFTGDILSDLKLPVFSGTRWTFYDAGMGACGATNENKDFIVALNAIQFGVGYPGPQCFKKITMEYNGKKATATIVDLCPECPYGALDLSRGLFNFFAPEDEGVIYGQWYFGEDTRRGDPPAPSKTKTKPSPTHAPNLPSLDPIRTLPGIAHPTYASESTRLSRPLDHSGEHPPVNLPSPARIPSSASNIGATARPNGNVSMGSELSPNTTILKPATPNAALKAPPLKSEYVSEDKSERSGNLVAFNTIFSRLGCLVAAGSATNRDESY